MQKFSMKYLLLTCLALAFSAGLAQAQVTIGEDAPPEATLDVRGNFRITEIDTGGRDILTWDWDGTSGTREIRRIEVPDTIQDGWSLVWNEEENRWEYGPVSGFGDVGFPLEIRNDSLVFATPEEDSVLIIWDGDDWVHFPLDSIDVLPDGCEEENILRFRGGEWVCDTISELPPGIRDNDILVWDEEQGRWIPQQGDLGGRQWLVGGNDFDGAFSETTDYIGTISPDPFITRTNDVERMRVTPTGEVIVGSPTSRPGDQFSAYGEDYAIMGYGNGLASDNVIVPPGGAGAGGFGAKYGVIGKALGTEENSAGVRGVAEASSGATFGVAGETNSETDYAMGVVGVATRTTGLTYGVAGETYSTSEEATGVFGIAGATQGARATYGVWGQTNSEEGANSAGLVGLASASATTSPTFGVVGQSFSESNGSAGVSGIAFNGRSYGVSGVSQSASDFSGGVLGVSTGVGQPGFTYFGVRGVVEPKGDETMEVGVYGQAANYGVLGVATRETTVIEGSGRENTGVYGVFSNNDIGAVGTKQFHIDHPLDPENKYLSHVCPESNEALNIYSGNVTTNANGEAVVQLPEYFDAINKDARYNLTAIGSFADVIVLEKVQNNQFKIKSSEPNVEVSWMVMAVRNDAYMQKYPFRAVADKAPQHKGKYLAPELYNQPQEKSIFSAPDNEVQQPGRLNPKKTINISDRSNLK